MCKSFVYREDSHRVIHTDGGKLITIGSKDRKVKQHKLLETWICKFEMNALWQINMRMARGVCECQGVFVNVNGCLWMSRGVCECQGVFVNVKGCLWNGSICFFIQ